MEKTVAIVGAGLAGSEAALQLASQGIHVRLYEMRPVKETPVHKTPLCAELVCSNSLKSTKPESAAGMLKEELSVLGSYLYGIAQECAVPAGGALAVDRSLFATTVTEQIEANSYIELVRNEVTNLQEIARGADAIVLATGPLTSDALSETLYELLGTEQLSFYDAAAPIVMADSLSFDVVFRQSRYDKDDGSQLGGDYLNAPFEKDEYEQFIHELINAKRHVAHDFETRELFQACQPIEEIARKGHDAPRFGPLKPVGLTDPHTGRRPWAVVQLRAENREGSAYNLVGFQTNLTFAEQQRVFRMIPGLEQAEFARFGVMHRNTFVDAPRTLNTHLQFTGDAFKCLAIPVFAAGQLAGTEGYCEAIRSGLHVAIEVAARLKEVEAPALPVECAFGSLLQYATNPQTQDYQPMHVNFGIMKPLESSPRNKAQRYSAYAKRGREALEAYKRELIERGLLQEVAL